MNTEMQKQWYIIQTYVGFEHRVKAALERKLGTAGDRATFGEILLPKEKVVDLVRGKKQTVEQRLFPGYLFAHLVLNEKNWYLIHSVPKVVGFLGDANVPVVIPEEQVRQIIRRVESGQVKPRPKVLFVVGEQVKVVDGPFRDFTGTVAEVNDGRSRVKVALSVFGRPTPVDLDFIQVEAA
jgi:transcriptional antiterminator NusG